MPWWDRAHIAFVRCPYSVIICPNVSQIQQQYIGTFHALLVDRVHIAGIMLKHVR